MTSIPLSRPDWADADSCGQPLRVIRTIKRGKKAEMAEEQTRRCNRKAGHSGPGEVYLPTGGTMQKLV